MKLIGLSELLKSILETKPSAPQLEIKAKHHPYRLQAKPANPIKKKRHKIVQASKRRNRG